MADVVGAPEVERHQREAAARAGEEGRRLTQFGYRIGVIVLVSGVLVIPVDPQRLDGGTDLIG